MKALYAATFDPNDISKWSGLVYHIGRSLELAGVELDKLGPLRKHHKMANALNSRLRYAIDKKPYPIERTLGYARSCANAISSRMERTESDLTFCPSSIPVALLKHERPSVIYTDATFQIVLDQYPEMRNYPERYLQQGMEIEQQAMKNAAAIVFSSQWAANSAVNDHGADPKKVHVVPFGSNLPIILDADEVHSAIQQRSRDICEILFVAVRWKSKGGDTLLKIADKLWKAGVPVRVTLVGCEPENMTLPAHVDSVGFIDKSTASGQERMKDLMLRSHFMVLPTRIDCTPVVFSECASFGLPCLSNTDVGGISEVIRSGVNGETFTDDAQRYADYIAEMWNSPHDYERLARSSRGEYELRLNWKTSGRKLRLIMEQACNDRMAISS